MSRRRSRIQGQWTWQYVEMKESPAWRVLSLSARRVLDRIEIELAHHGGKENGRLPVTYDHFAEYGIDRHSIAPAIRECVALGFVEVTPGIPGNKDIRRPNLFRLTWRETDHRAETNNWKRFKTTDEAEAARRLSRVPIKRGRPAKNRRPMRETPTVTVRKTPTENRNSPMGETPTTGPVKTPTTSISRVGTAHPTDNMDELRASLQRVAQRSRRTPSTTPA